jgi:hypothetical protein
MERLSLSWSLGAGAGVPIEPPEELVTRTWPSWWRWVGLAVFAVAGTLAILQVTQVEELPAALSAPLQAR